MDRRTSGVTSRLSVTVLPNMVATQPMYVKLYQKYGLIEDAIIYVHANFEIEQKIVHEEKKGNLHLNSFRLRIRYDQFHPQPFRC